jgi:hypothetical protein
MAKGAMHTFENPNACMINLRVAMVDEKPIMDTSVASGYLQLLSCAVVQKLENDDNPFQNLRSKSLSELGYYF